MNKGKRTARVTGFLYLLLALIGPFSLMYVPGKIMIPGDPSATITNLRALESLFRLGMAGQSLIFLIELALPVLLYVLLKSVHKPLALIAAFSRLSMAIVQGVNLLIHFAALQLLKDGAILSAFSGRQIQDGVFYLLNLHQSGAMLWQIFFGFHLILIAFLIFKSPYFPKWLGILLWIAAGAYWTQSYMFLMDKPFTALQPWMDQVLLWAMIPGEVALLLWLLIKGIRTTKK